MGEGNVAVVHGEILLSCKNNEILSFTTKCTELEIIMLNETNLSQRQELYNLTHVNSESMHFMEVVSSVTVGGWGEVWRRVGQWARVSYACMGT